MPMITGRAMEELQSTVKNRCTTFQKRGRGIRHRRIMMSVLALFLLTLWGSPSVFTLNEHLNVSGEQLDQRSRMNQVTTSAVGGAGNELGSMMGFTREIQNQDLYILNSYANTSEHSEVVDVTGYRIPGWTLYEVIMDVQKMTAAPEREVVGSSSSPQSSGFRIYEHDIDAYYDQLTQAFYNQSHDGRLANFSLLYISPRYSSAPSPYGYAYFELRSNYSEGSTNMISTQQVPHVGITPTWVDFTTSVNLAANELYWATINGSLLVKSGALYPDIRWYYEPDDGEFTTYRHNTEDDKWLPDLSGREALLNYTYTPWNLTADQAITYTDPQSVELVGNLSAVEGGTWFFNSPANLSSIDFKSNQSVYISYDLTLRYRKSISSTTMWAASASGAEIYWNLTNSLSYPSVGGAVERTLNNSLPSDWTAVGLYNATNPSESHNHFVQTGEIVTCTSLDDDTWTLVCSAPNYIGTLSTFDSSDNSLIGQTVSVFVTMDVNSTVESPASVPVSGGAANLTVLYEGSKVHTEESFVTNGLSHHDWDIQSQSSGNGIYTIQVYWSNGTEAGYLAEDKIVFYPTELAVAKQSINSFTDSSFEVRVFFNDTFTPKGLNSTFAKVNYTFAAVVNNSMSDHPNGTWSKTIDTAGLDSGDYELVIYGEGFAVQNQSMTINVTLIHQTQSLTMEWSSGSNITFVEQTRLSVTYRRVGGVNITDAIVNVTIGVNTWNLTWDAGGEVYRITFNGSDSLPGFGSFSPTVSAWKQEHANQTSVTELTVRPEPVTLSASWVANEFDWTQNAILSFAYRDTYGTLIDQATQRLVWINGTENTLQGNNGTYWIELDNRFDLGYHSVVANVSKYGYVYGYNDTVEFTIILASTYVTVDWSSAEVDYLGRFDLSVLYALDSDDSNVPMGEVSANITIDGTTVLDLNETGIFWTANLTGTFLDLESHSVVIQTWAYGYEFQTNSTSLTVNEVSTQLTYYWSGPYTNNISYIQHTILYINYSMAPSGSIADWTVDVTVEGNPWLASWNSSLGVYECHFSGMDNPPGLGTHSVAIDASKFGYQNQTENSELTLRVAETSIIPTWSTEPPITYVENSTLIVIYSTSSGR
ncbi:MAG: hypothetical protein ACXADO_06150, partial [Candidatus Thorarchaeota archaeon]